MIGTKCSLINTSGRVLSYVKCYNFSENTYSAYNNGKILLLFINPTKPKSMHIYITILQQ